MRRSIVINGDDFGLSPNVNRAIIQAYTHGVLTSTSLMVTADAAAEAVALAQAHPALAVGLHLVLVCGRSALPAAQVPHLVDADGNFPDDSVKAGLRYQFSSAARQELRQEIRAQLEKFHQTGLPLSHVDGHLHLHMHPVVLSILTELAAEFDIRRVRLPSEELHLALQWNRQNWLQKLLWSTVFAQLRRHGEQLLKQSGIGWIDRVYGLLNTGAITEAYLLNLIPQIRANEVEIYCHPAVAPEAAIPTPESLELAALLSPTVRQSLSEAGFELSQYSLLQLSNR